MSFYTTQTKTVTVDKENSAVVRKLSYAEYQKVKSTATKVSLTQAGQTMGVDIDPFVMQTELLAAALVSWDGPGFEDRPVNRENILALPSNVGDLLATAADGLNSEPDDAEKKV